MRKELPFLCGEVRARLLGGEPERFLSACAEAGVPLRDVEYESGCSLRLRLAERDLAPLEKIAASLRYEVEILSLHGGSRSRRIARARSRLAAFAAVCALLLTLSGLFIWDFEVVGNEKLSRGEILRALADCGVSEGCFWPALDAESVRSRMLLRCGELAWMTLNVRGSRATVLVLEREEKGEIYAESAAAALVASRDGVVRELTVKNGRTLVSRGEAVLRGQTLVDPVMDGAQGERRAVRALGSVTADTWPERTIFVEPGSVKKERGKGFYLVLGIRAGKSRADLLPKGRKELDECDRIVKEYIIGIPGVFRFPLSLIAEIYRPYRAVGAVSPDLPGAQSRALAALADEIDGEILSYSFTEGEDRIVLRAHCLENIALTRESEDP